jgi:hypothetical protein
VQLGAQLELPEWRAGTYLDRGEFGGVRFDVPQWKFDAVPWWVDGTTHYLVSAKQEMRPELMLWRLVRYAIEDLKCKPHDTVVLGGTHGSPGEDDSCPGCDPSHVDGANPTRFQLDNWLAIAESSMVLFGGEVRFLSTAALLDKATRKDIRSTVLEPFLAEFQIVAQWTTEAMLAPREDSVDRSSVLAHRTERGDRSVSRLEAHSQDTLEPRAPAAVRQQAISAAAAAVGTSIRRPSIAVGEPIGREQLQRAVAAGVATINSLTDTVKLNCDNSLREVIEQVQLKARCVVLGSCFGRCGLCAQAKPQQGLGGVRWALPTRLRPPVSSDIVLKPPAVAQTVWYEWRGWGYRWARHQPAPLQLVAIAPESFATETEAPQFSFLSMLHLITSADSMVSAEPRRDCGGKQQ